MWTPEKIKKIVKIGGTVAGIGMVLAGSEARPTKVDVQDALKSSRCEIILTVTSANYVSLRGSSIKDFFFPWQRFPAPQPNAPEGPQHVDDFQESKHTWCAPDLKAKGQPDGFARGVLIFPGKLNTDHGEGLPDAPGGQGKVIRVSVTELIDAVLTDDGKENIAYELLGRQPIMAQGNCTVSTKVDGTSGVDCKLRTVLPITPKR